MNISIKLINNGGEYIANCPELDINCYGSNENEAVRRLKDVINFYINSAKELGIDINPLKDISIEGNEKLFIIDPALSGIGLLN
jgi:predicted RNase H-like HicB family nuclease